MALIMETVFGLLVVGLIVLAVLAFLGVKVFGGGRRDEAEYTAETRMIQELYQGMSRMERRIEALETLLLDRDDRDAREARGGRRPRDNRDDPDNRDDRDARYDRDARGGRERR